MLSSTVILHHHCILDCHPLQFYVPRLETLEQQQKYFIKEMLLDSSALAVVPEFLFSVS